MKNLYDRLLPEHQETLQEYIVDYPTAMDALISRLIELSNYTELMYQDLNLIETYLEVTPNNIYKIFN